MVVSIRVECRGAVGRDGGSRVDGGLPLRQVAWGGSCARVLTGVGAGAGLAAGAGAGMGLELVLSFYGALSSDRPASTTPV
jgi:hypothetical protein